MSTRQEKLAKLKEVNDARNAKLDEIDAAAADKRLDNELLIAELEAKNNLTLNVDMGVVWLTDGSMVVIRKPTYLAYERYQIDIQDAEKNAKIEVRDAYLKECVIHPTMQAAQQLNDVNGSCLFAACNLANRMHDSAGDSMEGKSKRAAS